MKESHYKPTVKTIFVVFVPCQVDIIIFCQQNSYYKFDKRTKAFVLMQPTVAVVRFCIAYQVATIFTLKSPCTSQYLFFSLYFESQIDLNTADKRLHFKLP